EQSQASTIEFTLRGMRGSDWRALKAQHPMSDDPTPMDQYLEADANGLFDAAVRLSMVDESTPAGPDWKPLDPDFKPLLDDEDWANLIDNCTDGDWERLTDA